MAIALDHLRRDRRRFESKPAANIRLNRGIQMSERANSTGDLADADDLARASHPFDIA
jgi:hypothetical protein